MPFPTIPTTGNSRIISTFQPDTTPTRSFPNMNVLTKNSGELLIAIIVSYQGVVAANAAFSGWASGWTEFIDSGSTTTMAIGAAYKFSTGSETGVMTVTQAATVTGHAAMIIMSIPNAHVSTPPEAGTRVTGTASAANPASFDPAGWAAENTLWIALGGSGEDSTTGSFTGTTTAPTNYSDTFTTGISADVVGGNDAAVAFRQLNASAEDVGTWTVDTSNARNVAAVIAVRPVTSVVDAIEQTHFRLRDDTQTINSTTFAIGATSQALDANASLPDANTAFRVRFEIAENNSTNESIQVADSNLQYNRNSAGWLAVTSSSSFIKLATSAQFADNAATTDIISGSAKAFTAGWGSSAAGGKTVNMTNNHTECEWSLTTVAADTVVGDTIQLRVFQSSWTSPTYTNTPTITITGTSPVPPKRARTNTPRSLDPSLANFRG